MSRTIIHKRSLLYSLFFCAISMTLWGCNEIAYYYQATAGQMKILTARKSIKDLLNDPKVDGKLKKDLQKVLDIREFAITSLKLPDNGSYKTLVDLKRKYVVWNVYAAQEFSVEPKK